MNLTCDICNCKDSEENPVLEILNDGTRVDKTICLNCFAKETNDIES
jgi:hypothetical protein